MGNIIYAKAQAFAPSAAGEDDLKAIDFDGSTELLQNTTETVIGVVNTWTVAVWSRLDGTPSGGMRVFDIKRAADTDSGIKVVFNTGGGWKVELYNSAGTRFKNYSFPDWLAANLYTDDWFLTVTTWDGTNLKAYLNGVEDTSPSKDVDDAGTQDDATRQITIGARQDAAQFFDGVVHSMAIWDVVLDGDSNTDLFNSGGQLDWTVATGNYTETADLQHYWRLGLDSADLGKDSGVASTLIDVDVNAQNVTSDDIVTDSPAA